MLLANPVAPAKQLPPRVLDEVLSHAWAEAERQSIGGNASTPFLLDFTQRDTGGSSLDVNVEVYRGTIALCAEIAAALAATRREGSRRAGSRRCAA